MMRRPSLDFLSSRRHYSPYERDMYRTIFMGSVVWILLHVALLWAALAASELDAGRWVPIGTFVGIDIVASTFWGLWKLSGWLFRE